MARLCFALILGAAPIVVFAQTAKIYVSSQAGDRLTAKPELNFTDGKPGTGAIFAVDDSVRFQKMDGFGASFMVSLYLTTRADRIGRGVC